MHSPVIAPSILSADFARLGAEVEAVLDAGWEFQGHGIVQRSMPEDEEEEMERERRQKEATKPPHMGVQRSDGGQDQHMAKPRRSDRRTNVERRRAANELPIDSCP